MRHRINRIGPATLLIFLIANLAYAAGPRTWNKIGTATTTNAILTVGDSTPFAPTSICIKNTGATNELWTDWTDGVAAATDGASNLRFAAGVEYCFDLDNPNVLGPWTIGVITNAATTTYEIKAIARR